MVASFILLSYGHVREYWLLQGYEENDLEGLWDSVDKVEVRRSSDTMVNPASANHRVRVDSEGNQFELLAKIPISDPIDPEDEVILHG